MRRAAFAFAYCLSASILPAQQATANAASSSKAQAGAQTYQAHCAVCHSVLPGATLVGPSLWGEMKTPAAASVRSTIINGKGRMRGLKGQLSPQEITNLLVYLRTLS